MRHPWIAANVLCFLWPICGGCGDNALPCGGAGDHRVTFQLFGVPLLLAYSDGGGDWHELEPSESGLYEMCVDDDYIVGAVCESASGVFLRQHSGRVSDQGSLALGLCGPGRVEGFVVSGEMLQPGGVFIGGGGLLSQQAPFAYELSVPAGRHTLVASNGYGLRPEDARLAIRRGLTVNQSQVQDAIDLEVEGTRFTPLSVGVSNPLDGEILSTSVELVIDSYPAHTFTSSSNIVGVADSAVLQPGDDEVITLAGSLSDMEGEYVRVGNRPFRGVPPVFELLPRVHDINYDLTSNGLVASWKELPTSDFTEVQLLGLAITGLSFVSASRGWLLFHGKTSLSFDSSMPGFAPEWTVIPTASTFIVTREVSSVERLTTSEHRSFPP